MNSFSHLTTKVTSTSFNTCLDFIFLTVLYKTEKRINEITLKYLKIVLKIVYEPG